MTLRTPTLVWKGVQFSSLVPELVTPGTRSRRVHLPRETNPTNTGMNRTYSLVVLQCIALSTASEHVCLGIREMECLKAPKQSIYSPMRWIRCTERLLSSDFSIHTTSLLAPSNLQSTRWWSQQGIRAVPRKWTN